MARNATMRKISLRNINAHKLRMALTVIAVVLGTAFISAAFMFTNSLSNSFSSAVNSAYSGVDTVVSAGEDSPGITAEQREAIASDPEVEKTNITASTTVVLATGDPQNPDPVQTGGGTSTMSIWYEPEDVVGQPHELVEGSAPTNADEVTVNAAAADEFDLAVDQELLVVDPQERHTVTITGIHEPETDSGGSVMVYTPEADYLERYTDGMFVDQLLVDGVEGTDPQALVDHLAAEFPELNVQTGQTLADEASAVIESALSFVNYFLVAFGLIALLVGTFLIANTFAMIVAQRTKEYALLRALGASRKQITRSVVMEAGIIGLIGSALGVLVGIALVAGIKAVMTAQGLAMPDSGLGLSTAAVLVPIILGTVVTVVSAWAPARKAGRIKPVEAMRSTESSSSQPLVVRTIIGLILIGAGIAAALWGALWDGGGTGDRASLVGIGALGVIVGFFMAGPAISIPTVPVFGRLIGLPFGAIGNLAATNSRRNPRRTSATAFALTLGVALVTVIGMFGATMKDSVSDLLDSNVTADYILTGPTTGSFPIPADAPAAAAETEGVEEIITYSNAPVAVDGSYGYYFGAGGTSDVVSGDPAEMLDMETLAGTTDLSDGGVIISEDFAAYKDWEVGESYELAARGISPVSTEVEVVGIYANNDIFGKTIISQDSVDELELPVELSNVLAMGANSDGSVSMEQLRTNLENQMNQFIVIQIMDAEEMSGQAGQGIDQMLNILYALLALALIIAVLGIVNTLTLSVIERRQELGMLRAVGSQRGQIRTLIILEAVQIAVFGAVTGVLMGLGLGWAFLTVLAGEGLDSLSVPWGLLAVLLGGSVVVGVLAALFPAQRAAKTPPLDAIAD